MNSRRTLLLFLIASASVSLALALTACDERNTAPQYYFNGGSPPDYHPELDEPDPPDNDAELFTPKCTRPTLRVPIVTCGTKGPVIGEWDVEEETIPIPSTQMPIAATLKLDQFGRLHVAMVTNDPSTGEDYVRYAHNGAGGAWEVRTLTSSSTSKKTLHEPRLAIDACANVAFLYGETWTDTSQPLRIAKKVNGIGLIHGWRFDSTVPFYADPPASLGEPVKTPVMIGGDIAFDAKNRLRFVGRDLIGVRGLMLSFESSDVARHMGMDPSSTPLAHLPIFAGGLATDDHPLYFIAEERDAFPAVVAFPFRAVVIANKRLPTTARDISPPLDAFTDHNGTTHVIWRSPNPEGGESLWYSRSVEQWTTLELVATDPVRFSSAKIVAEGPNDPIIYASAIDSSDTPHLFTKFPSGSWHSLQLPPIPTTLHLHQTLTIDGSGRLFILQSSPSTKKTVQTKVRTRVAALRPSLLEQARHTIQIHR